MKRKLLSALVLAQMIFINSFAWADETPDPRPHISNEGGGDRSPGVTAVIIVTLLLIGFGIGLSVGRRTRRMVK